MSHPYDRITKEQLKLAGSMKWSGMQAADGAQADGAWIAEMDFGLSPAIVETIHKAIQDGLTGYMPTWVPQQAREACANYQSEQFDWQIRPDQINLAASVLDIFQAIITSHTEPGAQVVVPTPAYMPFLSIPVLHGRKVVQVPAVVSAEFGWQLDLNGIEQAFIQGARLLVLCNPWNPTGRTFTRQELSSVGELAEKYRVLVFADEIHSPLLLPGKKHIPFASISPEFAARTITATAASKGWNIAGLHCAQAIVTDADLAKSWRPVGSKLSSQAVPLGALAATAAYNDSREWLADTCSYIAENVQLVLNTVANELPEVDIAVPEATYLTWWNCRNLTTGSASPHDIVLNEAHVGVNAGRTLGKGYEDFLRVNLATPRPVLRDMLARMTSALKAG